MKTLAISVSLVAALGFAHASAAAQSGALLASLSKPVASGTRYIVGDTVWACGQTQCQATVVTVESATWEACKGLARKAGVLTAYGSLDAAALAKCNEGAGK